MMFIERAIKEQITRDKYRIKIQDAMKQIAVDSENNRRNQSDILYDENESQP